jgi:hypothetical protein
MRRNTLNRIVALERSLAPGIDPIDRIILQMRAAVSDGDLRIHASLEALPESERTQSEQTVFERCEQAYIETFSAWTTGELKQIVTSADSSQAFPLRLRAPRRGPQAVKEGEIGPHNIPAA